MSAELKNQVESLLFSASKRLTLEELGRLCHEQNPDAIRVAIQLLQKELDDKQSSLMLVQEGDGWKLTVREKYSSIVKKVVKTPELPKSILETLAVVAYKAPVLQSKVIKIRTNKAYRHLDEIEELGYITREKKGRSKLIRLTPKFFDYFDVPPEKLKEKFSNVAALEQTIEQKETAIEQAQQNIVKAARENKPAVEVVTDELPKLAPEIEVVGDKVGELETYGEAKPKKARKKKHAPETAEKIAEEILAETEKRPAETEAPDEGRLTVEKIEAEAAKAKPAKEAYSPKGLFPEGAPPEIEERIQHRVEEIVEGEKPLPEESAGEVPETIPAPPERAVASSDQPALLALQEEPDEAEESAAAEEPPAEEAPAEPAEKTAQDAEETAQNKTAEPGPHEEQPTGEKPKNTRGTIKHHAAL
jgi:segregation and condensation protein B